MLINFVLLLIVGALCSAKPDVKLLFDCFGAYCGIRCEVTDVPMDATIHLSKTSPENDLTYEFSDKQPQYYFGEDSDYITIFFNAFYKRWEGYYTCTVKENTASHKTWTTDPVYIKSLINESNTAPARIYTVKTDYRQTLVNSGVDVRFQCSVDGIPEPKVTWKKIGNEDFLAVGPVLHFPSITREDQGQYVCVADNGIGKTNKTAKPIYVRTFKPAIKYSNPIGGVITLRQDEVNYNYPEEYNMEYKEMAVIVEGYYDPKVTWWKVTENGREQIPEDCSVLTCGFEFYNEPMRNDDSYYPDEGSKLSGLQIYNVVPEHLGTYVVKAENQLGTDELTFTMKLETN
ncbi:lachesin-like isoform X2 [Mytilus edulis]|uniref:lachesin-like isoform X2 n=1 Tax=Mytilus edulis TaxID=6550 RepID=UPI0039F07EC9